MVAPDDGQRASARQPFAKIMRDMAARDQSDRRHAGCPCRFDAVRAILDHERGRGRYSHLARGEKEEVGERLAAGHVVGAEHPARELVEQSDRREACLQAPMGAG